MSLTVNAGLSEQAKIVEGLFAVAPSSSTPDYVSLKTAPRLTIVIRAKNTTTVTGSAIALKQATSVAAGSEKALAFSTMKANLDTGATDTLVPTDVASNTFTTDATNSKNSMYVIEVQQDDLDVANNFDCVRVATGNSTNATVDVLYILWPVKAAKANPASAIID